MVVSATYPIDSFAKSLGVDHHAACSTHGGAMQAGQKPIPFDDFL
jgi:hypothetical protein